MLQVKELSFSYDSKKILKRLSFNVSHGEIVALIGTSGSGKSTLFRLLTGLLTPESGSIEAEAPISYMQQEDLLLPWRTVLANLLLVGELGTDAPPEALEEKALELLKAVGLDDVTSSLPEELSGGMRQRVSLVRALLQNRPLLLLDEPFGSLDVIIREELYLLLRKLQRQYQKTVVLVTHDFRDAFALADRILVLAHGEIARDISLNEEIKSDPVQKEALMVEIKQALAAPTMCAL